MSLTLIALYASGSLCILSIIMLIKSQINYSIRMRWIDEIFSETNHVNMLLAFNKVSYEKTFLDFSLWKHVPFKEYIKKLEQTK